MEDENQPQDASENPEGTEDKSEGSEDSNESEESEKAVSFGAKDMTKMMANAISDGISKGMAAIQNNAGLVDKSPAEKQRELIKEADTGALVAAVFGMDKHI